MAGVQPSLKIIRAGKLVDGLGGPPKKGMAVLVEDEYITRVFREGELSLPEGATVEMLDFPKATLLPGLVDCHTHTNMPGDGTSVDDVGLEGDDIHLLQAVKQARIALESGVTTMRDNGGWHKVVFSLKDGIRRELVPGPRILASGRPITMTGGHCWMMGSEADGVDGVRQAVRQLVLEGVDFIKVMATGGSTRGSMPEQPSYTLDELKAVTDEAHRRARFVGAHAIAQQGIVNALDAGVDMLIHCTFVQPDGSIKFDPRVGERIASSGTWVNPTIQVRRSVVEFLEQKLEDEGLTPAEEEAQVQSKVELEGRLEVTRRLISAGARVVGGSDCGWNIYPFGQFHKELESLVLAGFSAGQAVLAGTSEAAKSLGVADQIGTIEPGKEADLLVVGGDPTQDILALASVVAVFKSGVRVR